MLVSSRARLPARLTLLFAVCALIACGRANAPSAPPHNDSPLVETAPAHVAPLAVAPPDIPEATAISAHDAAALSVTVLHLGRLIVAFERTPMRDAQSQIGAGIFDEQGDGAEWKSWLCYTVPGSQRVWLTSNQPGGEFINGFALVAEANAQPSAHCPALPAAYTPIVLEPDLHLGTPSDRVQRLLGAGPIADQWSLYRHVHSSDHDSLHFDETYVLTVKMTDGRVVGLAGAKATTN